MSISITNSAIAGFWLIDGEYQPKGQFSLKYGTSERGTRVFSLINNYSGKPLYELNSRSYTEIDGVSSWTELISLLNKLGILSRNDAGGISTDRTPMFQVMDTVGDGSGSGNMAVDGSTAPVMFKVAPPAGSIYGIARIITSLSGSGLDSGGWGNSLGTPLTNGFELIWHRGGVDYNLTENPIQSFFDLAAVCHDLVLQDWGQGSQFITARFTFTKAGQYLMLNGDDGDYLAATVNDDLSTIVDYQKISAQGFQI